MTIFRNAVFAFELGNLPVRERNKFQQLVTKNEGKLAYTVSKKVDYCHNYCSCSPPFKSVLIADTHCSADQLLGMQ